MPDLLDCTCPQLVTGGAWALLLGMALAAMISLFGLLIYAFIMHYVSPSVTIHERLIHWLDARKIR